MKPNLRIFTSTALRSSNPPYASMLTHNESSSKPGPQGRSNHNGFGTDEGIEEISRTIRRSFAFDEWDDEDIEDHEDEAAETSSIDRTLQRIIRRTFAFDEWDDEEMGFLAGTNNNEKSFVPIQSENESCIISEDGDAGAVTNLFKASSLPSNAQTKFDIDNTYTAITPSPASKQSARIQRPFPLYSHQVLEGANRFSVDDVPTRDLPFPHDVFEQNKSIRANVQGHPTDYHNLDLMLHGQPYASDPCPPQCESIPRQASAFDTVGSTKVAERTLPRTNSSNQIDHAHHSIHNPLCPNPSQELEGILFDRDCASFLFEEDDVFDSPSSFSDDSTTSTIPRFIMFCNKSK